ncbi:helix-turn-helix transcriptional regulator [Roseomonas aeriglobus]|nr:helix-turn-helix transcriptional regulator [Roseomonas aeriglobus]
MLGDRPELHTVAAALESGATAFTVCELAEGVTLAGPAFEGVAAYHVLAGTMHVRLQCGAHHVAPADTMMLVPARQAPRLSMAADGDDDVVMDGRSCLVRAGGWIVADATGGRPPGLIVAAARITGTDQASLSAPQIIPLSNDAVGRRLSALLREEVANPGAANGAFAIAIMTSCIVLALRKAMVDDGAGASTTGRSAPFVSRALAAVRSEPGAPHTPDTLATAAGMSRATFVRQFARATGKSPMQFVQELRLSEAAGMLRTGALPVKTVAAQTGFASRSHFSRAFRKAYGCDPTSFRQQAPLASSVE